jgi:CheY-like chemotaxis protein
MTNGKNINVLIVDDDEDMCIELQDILLVSKYSVDFATNGGKGLDLLNAKKYDLMLLDLKMVGIDGYDVLENVKTQYPDLKVIVMTGCILEKDIVCDDVKKILHDSEKEDILKMADFILHKPYDVEVLLAKIKELTAK